MLASDCDVIVECLGGIELPFQLIARALSDGLHVVTANKAVIAEHGEALFKLADSQNLKLCFFSCRRRWIAILGNYP